LFPLFGYQSGTVAPSQAIDIAVHEDGIEPSKPKRLVYSQWGSPPAQLMPILFGADEGNRTLNLLHGKQALYR
jgi:hypothetical protein